jgi:hypothetical protein
LGRTAPAAIAVHAHGLPTLCQSPVHGACGYVRCGRARVPERLSSGHRPCTVRCDRLGRARSFVRAPSCASAGGRKQPPSAPIGVPPRAHASAGCSRRRRRSCDTPRRRLPFAGRLRSEGEECTAQMQRGPIAQSIAIAASRSSGSHVSGDISAAHLECPRTSVRRLAACSSSCVRWPPAHALRPARAAPVRWFERVGARVRLARRAGRCAFVRAHPRGCARTLHTHCTRARDLS